MAGGKVFPMAETLFHMTGNFVSHGVKPPMAFEISGAVQALNPGHFSRLGNFFANFWPAGNWARQQLLAKRRGMTDRVSHRQATPRPLFRD